MRFTRLGIAGITIAVFSPFVVFAQISQLPPIGSVSTQAESCIGITRNLSFGSRGSDVIQLQQYLISQSLLASDNATGYFGRLTEQAVQQWQSSHGVVWSGTAATTGYGALGPKTRAALASACSGVNNPSTSSQTSPKATSGTAGQANSNQSTINELLAQVKVLQEKLNALLKGGTSATSTSCSWSGGTVASGSTVAAYQSSSVANGSSCQSETRTCTNGTLSGSYANASCVVGTASSCTWNNQTIANGATVTAYQSSSVPFASQCTSEQRTCTNGTISGSHQNATCIVSERTPHPYPNAFQILIDANQLYLSESAQASRFAADGVWSIPSNSGDWAFTFNSADKIPNQNWSSIISALNADTWSVSEDNPGDTIQVDFVSSSTHRIVDKAMFYEENNFATIIFDAQIAGYASHAVPGFGALGARVVVLARGYVPGDPLRDALNHALANPNVSGAAFELVADSPGIPQLKFDEGCRYVLSLHKKCYFLIPPSTITTDWLNDIQLLVNYLAESGGILNNPDFNLVIGPYGRPRDFHFVSTGANDHNSIEAIVNWLKSYRSAMPSVPPLPADLARKPRGWLDVADCSVVGGWSQDQDTPNWPIMVHMYIDGTMAGYVRAEGYRSDLCTAIGSCGHAFTWSIPSQFKDGIQHTINVFGIDSTVGTNNTLLSGSPKTFQCTQ